MEGWLRLLVNLGLAFEDRGRTLPSVAGLLLFGKNPNRQLPQAGISAVAFGGTEKDYDIKARAVLRGPLVSLFPPEDDPYRGRSRSWRDPFPSRQRSSRLE